MPTGDNPIVKKYMAADSENRLSLFLHYPQLRNIFIDIDCNEKRVPGRAKEKQKTASEKSIRTRWCMAITSCRLRPRRPDP